MPRKKATKAKKTKAPKRSVPVQGSSELLTPSQVASMIGTTPRTLARWAVACSHALSSTASVKGKKRFFSSYDVQQLQQLADLIKLRGLTIQAAASSLTVIEDVDEEEVQGSALVLSTEAAGQVATVVERTQNMVNEINRLRDVTALQQAEIAELRELVNSLVSHESKPALERLVSKYRKPDTTTAENKFRITGADGFVEVPNYHSPPIVEELPEEEDKGGE